MVCLSSLMIFMLLPALYLHMCTYPSQLSTHVTVVRVDVASPSDHAVNVVLPHHVFCNSMCIGYNPPSSELHGITRPRAK